MTTPEEIQAQHGQPVPEPEDDKAEGEVHEIMEKLATLGIFTNGDTIKSADIAPYGHYDFFWQVGDHHILSSEGEEYIRKYFPVIIQMREVELENMEKVIAQVVATREEVEDLKRQWAFDPIFEIVPTDLRFEPYADELREFEKQKNAEWEQAAIEKESAWLKTFKSNFYYQLSLSEMNRLVTGGYRMNVISTIVHPEVEEWGDMGQFERNNYFIIYTVQII